MKDLAGRIEQMKQDLEEWRGEGRPGVADLADMRQLKSERDTALARVAELEAKVAELQHTIDIGCECPPPDCDCPGCWARREENEAEFASKEGAL